MGKRTLCSWFGCGRRTTQGLGEGELRQRPEHCLPAARRVHGGEKAAVLQNGGNQCYPAKTMHLNESSQLQYLHVNLLLSVLCLVFPDIRRFLFYPFLPISSLPFLFPLTD